ncbi:MAG: NEW3 domain-containing protein [Armatimonadetes bacterium]|nr:NEW3 domain-containing protein [Armatimonadota bacterium]
MPERRLLARPIRAIGALIASAGATATFTALPALKQDPVQSITDPPKPEAVHVRLGAPGGDAPSPTPAEVLGPLAPNARAEWRLGWWQPLDGASTPAWCDNPGVRVAAVQVGPTLVALARNTLTGPATVWVQAPCAAGPASSEVLTVPADPAAPALSGPTFTYAYTVPRDLGRGVLLRPGELAVFRFTNWSRQATVCAADVASAWRPAAPHAASQARKGAASVRAACSRMGAIGRGGLAAARLLEQSHGALLHLAFLESVTRNAAGSDPTASGPAQALGAAILRAQRCMGACSAAALGLATQVETNPREQGNLSVSVSVTNRGRRTVQNVRLWVSGPEGAGLTPSVESSFGSLATGQAARASYTVEPNAPPEAGAVQGHITYYMARTPAHLRFPAVW